MPHQVMQSSTQGFYVFADDAESFGEGLAGLDITVSLSKSGGTYNTVSPTITDLGGGVYWVAPLAAHRDTLGEIAWQFTADGAVIAPRFERVIAVNDQSAHWGVPAATLAAAAVSPIHADVRAVNGNAATPATDVAKESSVQTLLEAVEAEKDYPGVTDVRVGVEYANGLYVGVLDVGSGLPVPEYPKGSPGL